MNGKGDKRRPRLVDRKTYEINWDLIFRRNAEDSTDERQQEPSTNERSDSNKGRKTG